MGQKLMATRSFLRASALAATLVAALVITASPASAASNFNVTCSASDAVATWSGGGVKFVSFEWNAGFPTTIAPTGHGSADLDAAGAGPPPSGGILRVVFAGGNGNKALFETGSVACS